MPAVLRRGTWILSVAAHATTLSPDRRTVYAFDLEGRPLSWFERGRTYKRSLASEVHVRERRDGARWHGRLTDGEAREAFARALACARGAGEALEGTRGKGTREAPGARAAAAPGAGEAARLRRRLRDILRWTPRGLLEERRRFEAAYRPIAILPPDQYLSIVLQPTFGCTWNRCTFCSFYQDRAFSVRGGEAFAAHVRAVAVLLGRAARARRSLFLADGNALVLANERLHPILETAAAAFPGRPIGGFVDVFTGERKPAADWVDLRARGLRRVYLGFETGHDPLLRWMNKPGGASEALAFCRVLKAAGVSVGVIFLCGAGGERFAAGHVRDTLALAAGLPLDPGDLVYLSPFVEPQGSSYAARAAGDGIRPLDPAAIEVQRTALRDGIRRAHPGVRVARYDIREFLY